MKGARGKEQLSRKPYFLTTDLLLRTGSIKQHQAILGIEVAESWLRDPMILKQHELNI